MKTTIKHNGKEIEITLTPEQEALVMAKGERWEPKMGENYCYVTDDGHTAVTIWNNDDIDRFRLSQGNCFKTEEEAEARREYLKAVATIKADAEWWKPDWEDWKQVKWFGVYDHEDRELLRWWNVTIQNPNIIYFPSKELLKKSQETHRKEWLLVAGVKEEV